MTPFLNQSRAKVSALDDDQGPPWTGQRFDVGARGSVPALHPGRGCPGAMSKDEERTWPGPRRNSTKSAARPPGSA